MSRHFFWALFLLLPASARAEEPPPKGVPPLELLPLKAVEAPRPEVLDKSLKRGIAFLLADQNKDGSWGGPERTKGLNIYAPVPGAHHAFRGAVTGLCISALIETGGGTPEVTRAVERAEAWLLENLPKLRRANADTLYNIWGHAYGIQALVRMHERLPGDAERRRKIQECIRGQMELLERYESVDGGWGYYDFRAGTQRPATDSTPFQTATVLVAFHEAKQIGVEPPEKVVKRAVASIIRQRKPDFTYLYGEYLKWNPMMPVNLPGGSLGRSQACNLAVRLWGDDKVTDDVLIAWLTRLFARNGWLDMGRKRPIPHESHFQVAGYFFYFGHYYAALCIDQLKPGKRPFFQDHLAQVLLHLQEEDGSWWDYPLYNYHQQYGTAFTLMALHRCRHQARAIVPLRQAHAHNDYEHERPLLDALDHGFCSVEADIYLTGDQLLIAHERKDLRPERTLEKLYLDPLRQRTKANGGRVYPGGPTIYLLIDVKTEARETYAALHKVLARYDDILSVCRDGRFEPKAVTVVISGNCAREAIMAQPVRYAGIDGRPPDLDSTAPAHLLPWISARWGSVFSWQGEGSMPQQQRDRLQEFVRKAHAQGRLVRFWATPESAAFWKELRLAGVDLINTDKLAALQQFLLDSEPNRKEP
jgi:hypothetical protein